MGYGLLAASILFLVGVPALVSGTRAETDPDTDPQVLVAQAAKRGETAATPEPASVATDAVAGDRASEAAAASEPPPVVIEPGPKLDKDSGRMYRRTSDQAGHGQPVEPPDFECRGVRDDETAGDDQFPVPLPPFSKDVYPCTRCHDKPTDFNPTRRKLTVEHVDIKLVHGPREQWCYGCHNPANRDQLRLAGGRTVTFLESYELCGQCHGTKLRDWRMGIHGRRNGCWNGKREYLLCVHCHSPHAPKFAPLTPLPRPDKPTELGLRRHGPGGK